jgi:hypothetical protein
MQMKLLAATAAVGFTMALSAGAQAAPLTLLGTHAAANQSLAVQVDYRDRCEHRRHECAERWGWGTWRFRRCVRLHRCG